MTASDSMHGRIGALSSSFHVIGEQFARVWPHGSFNTRPQGPGVQTTTVGLGSSTVVDLSLEVPGNYVLVDHALARLDRGAWAMLHVTGATNKTVYTAINSDESLP